MMTSPAPKAMPLTIGIIHFIGIGGIGMSGIAEILHNLGYKVQGSDLADNANVDRLRKLGITVFIGQKAEHIENAAVVVKSSAVKDNNPEIAAARERYIPVVRRAEMLAEITRLKNTIAIAGTHGKTTTTSLMAALLDAAGWDPTVINGGIINAYGTNARLGKGDWLVAEADESDGTFIALPATVGVVTNIDPEHLEHYGSFDGVKAAFKTFISNLPFYGFAVMCKDHPEVKALLGQIKDRKIFTYGIETDGVDVKAVNIHSNVSGSTYDVELSARLAGEAKVIKALSLPMPGIHNVLNSLAVVAASFGLGIGEEAVRAAFGGFEGVKRRFTKTGEVAGITVVDDYGHHPKEIAASLKAAQDVQRGGTKGKVIAVVQPHRYSRVHDLFNDFAACFAVADKVILADIYAAGEVPIEGITRDALAAAIRKTGHPCVITLDAPSALAEMVVKEAVAGDLVICLGAGNITQWANVLPDELALLLGTQGGERSKDRAGVRA